MYIAVITVSQFPLERSALCCCEIGSVKLKEESELKVACINEHE